MRAAPARWVSDVVVWVSVVGYYLLGGALGDPIWPAATCVCLCGCGCGRMRAWSVLILDSIQINTVGGQDALCLDSEFGDGTDLCCVLRFVGRTRLGKSAAASKVPSHPVHAGRARIKPQVVRGCYWWSRNNALLYRRRRPPPADRILPNHTTTKEEHTDRQKK